MAWRMTDAAAAPMKLPPDLSVEMKQVIDFMRLHGGKIHRHGGYWWRERLDGMGFGTSTINALERRGCIRYTEYKRGRGGEFPILAELVAGLAS
jgi:RimJ/RimL family protein N-acetyltransferase